MAWREARFRRLENHVYREAQKLRIVPNLNGDGFVALGARSSDLSRDEFDNLLEAMEEFCATAGLTPPPPREPPAPPRMVAEPPKRKLLAAPKAEEIVF